MKRIYQTLGCVMAKSGESVPGRFTDNGMSTDRSYFCTSCQLEQKQIPAEGFCSTCDEYLCEICFKYHIRLLVSRDHVLLHIDEMPQMEEKEASPSDVLEEKCECHRDKIVDFYCKTCDEVGCYICVTTNHKKCQVVYIPEHTKDIDDDKIKSEAREKACKVGEAKNAEKIVYRCKCNVELFLEKERNSIKLFRKEINETFDRIEQNIEKKISRKKKELLSMLESNSQNLAKQRNQLETSGRTLQRHIYTSTRSSKPIKNKMFVGLKLYTKEVKQIETCKEALIKELQKQELQKQTFNIETSKDLRTSLRQVISAPERDLKTVRVKLTYLGRIDVKQNIETFSKQKKTLTKCCISSCVAFSDDTLLLNDSENKSVILCKILEASEEEKINAGERNREMRIISMEHFGVSLWDITKMDDRRAAITLPSKRMVQILRIFNDNIELDKCIVVSGSCYGIAYMDKKLYVSFTWLAEVEIIDSRGNFLRTVSNSLTESVPQYQFSQPKYVACDLKRKLTYISDNEQNCIVVTDDEGKILSVIHYPIEDLDQSKQRDWMRNPLSLSVWKDGSVFVAVDCPWSVQRIHTDCIQKDVLIWKGVSAGIHALTCYNNRLYFGTSAGTLHIWKITTE